MSKTVRVLFVGMGNICRSPTAEGVFKRHVRDAGLEGVILSDSAGTHKYHVGEPPDRRAREAAQRRGYDLTDLRARRVTTRDFETFDLVLAMDEHNLKLLERMPESASAEDLQTEVYEIGKREEFGFESLRDWFRALYETLLGSSQGPRMGSFIALYGVANTRRLIAEALAKA